MANKGLNRAAQRIQRELQEIMNEEFSKSGISVEPTEDNFMKLKGKILGPPGTPYEEGIFMLQIDVPDGYPFKPVKARFLTKIWHPNISSVTGAICINILNQDWVPCITLRTVLISLQALLAAAEPDSPQDAVVGKQYKENYELFKTTAKHWSQVYAGAHNLDFKRNLMGGGVDNERATGSNAELERNVLEDEIDDEGVPGSNAELETNLTDGVVDNERASGSDAEFANNVMDGEVADERAPGSNAALERNLMDGGADDERVSGSNAELESNVMDGEVEDERAPESNAELEANLMDRVIDDERVPVSNEEFERNVVDREESEERPPVASSSNFWGVAKAVVHFIFR